MPKRILTRHDPVRIGGVPKACATLTSDTRLIIWNASTSWDRDLRRLLTLCICVCLFLTDAARSSSLVALHHRSLPLIHFLPRNAAVRACVGRSLCPLSPSHPRLCCAPWMSCHHSHRNTDARRTSQGVTLGHRWGAQRGLGMSRALSQLVQIAAATMRTTSRGAHSRFLPMQGLAALERRARRGLGRNENTRGRVTPAAFAQLDPQPRGRVSS